MNLASRLPARPLPGATGKPTASISLDLDNRWSYMKTHGDAGWESYPTYLSTVVPRMLALFEETRTTATVFIVGQDAALADKNGEHLATITAAGHEVGNHSFAHDPWVHLFDQGRLVDEIVRTEEEILAVTGVRPTGFRGPGYSLSTALVQLLADRGYSYDASTLPTWIGPLARQYYFRTAHLDEAQKADRKDLFGHASDAKRPVAPYVWQLPAAQLLEIPVTVMPAARVPFHLSYVLQLHTIDPRLARRWFSAATRLCLLAGVGPSVLLHPLDLLGKEDAGALGFFPGMEMETDVKVGVVRWALEHLHARFDLVPMGEHASRLLIDPHITRRVRSTSSLPAGG